MRAGQRPAEPEFEKTLLRFFDNEGFHLKTCLQIYSFYDENDEHSLTFCIETDAEKIAFANWIIENKLKLGDFRLVTSL